MICSKYSISGEGSTIYFLMYDVWLSLCIIQCMYISSTTFISYEVKLLMEPRFYKFSKFGTLT
jgi:hypothetical protein